MGPYGLAFGVGYALGLIVFGGQNALDIDNPAGWTEYICPGGGGPGALVGPVTTLYQAVPGVDPANCIAGQFVSGSGNILRQGYWRSYGPGANDHAHVASFYNAPLATPIPALREVRMPQPVADPALEEWIGPGIYANPLSAPVALPGFTPNVFPQPATSRPPRPSPGVGTEGYLAGEPVMGSQPLGLPAYRPQVRPSPNPKRPEKHTKERKVASRAYRIFGGLYGAATEMEDFVDSLHKAIDPRCGRKAQPVWDSAKRGYASDGKSWRRVAGRWVRQTGAYRAPSLLEKAAKVYTHANCIDIGQALVNLVENAIEDRVIAAGSKQMRKASAKRYGEHYLGYGLGPAL